MRQHFFIMGDSGVGKSQLMRQFLWNCEKKGETAVVFDPEREFIKEFLNPERGDWVLDPKDNRCPDWNIFDEVTDEADAIATATSQFPHPALDNSSSGMFFHGHCVGVYAYLLAYAKKTIKGAEKAHTKDLGYWLAHPEEEIDPRLVGSEHVTTLSKNSPNQRGGVLGTLNEAGKALRMMPGPDEGRRSFSIRDWAQHRHGWIFICSTPETESALRPLQSMWADLIFLRLLSAKDEPETLVGKIFGKAPSKPVTVVLEELGNLHHLTQLPNAITRMRKRGHSIIMGLQNREQLERIYGRHAKTIFSQCRTKFVFATSEEESAKALQGLIGDGEWLRLKESFNEGKGATAPRSWTTERVREPLIMASEIQGMEDMEFLMVQRDLVVKGRLPYVQIDAIAPALIERAIPPMERRPLAAVSESEANGGFNPARQDGQAGNEKEPEYEPPKRDSRKRRKSGSVQGQNGLWSESA